MKPLIRDLLAYTLQATGITEPQRRFGDHLFIATFHRVLPESQRRQYPLPGLAVTPEELAWFVRFFQQRFLCQRLDLAWLEYSAGKPSNLPRLAITFDDGQLDNYLHAAPVLDSLGVSATFFIPVEAVETQQMLWHDRMGYAIQLLKEIESQSALLVQLAHNDNQKPATPQAGVTVAKHWPPEARLNWIKKAEATLPTTIPDWDGMMNWEQIHDLSRRGHEIGSHSYSHPLLTQCDDSHLEREITTSKQRIEAETRSSIFSFCYPNGDHDQRVVDAVAQAGYSLAVTTHWGSNAPGTAPHALQRHDMVATNASDRHGRLSSARMAMRMTGWAQGVQR
ncbi:polysaccharide deacetylase family protein [Desulfurivibrio alkaliphilus]|uniref:Polysaccharide deacetylase n=1 Tax=Desulfurivibrio alkaliphilus (strain DSM 19089 / UNIQEM U267 / AHT2) TaxID=589865 RepID=D6Z4G3_DESAT|nr:polysaccharide deacetylase family protein [Desulfurivibrio alkaliphilus]ADH86438.1 polysaccharide deacetylase [Desulfurivibrio alkaliphilus AHT 2]